jgi:hypothetical protein
MRAADLVNIWRHVMTDDATSWVLFRNGTCVVLPDPGPDADLANLATELLRAYGPTPVEKPGDFGVISRHPEPGWLVWCHQGDISTYVDPSEVREGTSDLDVGKWGRSKRDWDAHELEVTHVEDRRQR